MNPANFVLIHCSNIKDIVKDMGGDNLSFIKDTAEWLC